ncbi:CAP domain-containing protein [Legionella maioricensis]|uniref:CAP domain-containing protein n=1 Tax=Legionella maioricensis TaxID=2896528 RepID=A0A9X2IC62_9GAMM|nr:CAP domain-containing protein [Legionella maioricensis]MCL9683423.1 CAP domain-containing protein [Legionella maioricensis]MCL9688594.1 CAP domain-containing protein [Legionella maioricensis]
MKFKSFRTTIIITSLVLSLLQLAHAGKSIKQVDSDTAIQNAILVHINEYRQKHGLSPLKMDDKIVKEAKIHSLDMANHRMPFGHKYFNSRIDRLHAQIKNSNAGAENVAYNYKNAQDVVNNWVRSPGHKRNIEGNYNLTGIGIARDKQGKIYFTQIFLRTGRGAYAARRPSLRIFNNSFFRKSA